MRRKMDKEREGKWEIMATAFIYFFAEVLALIAKNTDFEGPVGRSLSRLKRRFQLKPHSRHHG